MWITCRWRFDASTASLSRRPKVPIPAAERYSDAELPRPPQPMIRRRVDLRESWPERNNGEKDG